MRAIHSSTPADPFAPPTHLPTASAPPPPAAARLAPGSRLSLSGCFARPTPRERELDHAVPLLRAAVVPAGIPPWPPRSRRVTTALADSCRHRAGAAGRCLLLGFGQGKPGAVSPQGHRRSISVE